MIDGFAYPLSLGDARQIANIYFEDETSEAVRALQADPDEVNHWNPEDDAFAMRATLAAIRGEQ